MRNSLKEQRDEVLFQFFKSEVKELEKQAVKGDIDLYYFDETHLSLAPPVPYAWQKKGTTACLPSQKDNCTILGFLSTQKQDFYGITLEGAADAKWVVKAFEEFTKNLSRKRKTIVILDNASIHTAGLVKAQMNKWKEKGLHLQFIPAYSPELNKIEILWKQLKHFWLEKEHYQNLETLIEGVRSILRDYGKKYMISFE